MSNSDDGDHSGPRALLTRRRLTIAGTVLVVAGLLVAFRAVNLDRVVGEMLRADPRLLAAAVAVYAASWPLRGRRYGDVLSTTGHPLGTGFLTLAVFLSQTANLVVPARGGDAVRAYVLKARVAGGRTRLRSRRDRCVGSGRNRVARRWRRDRAGDAGRR